MTVPTSQAAAGAILAAARALYVSGCAAEIGDLPAMLRQAGTAHATVTGLFSPLLNQASYADAEAGLRMRTFFLNRATRRHLAAGLVEYCPWRYRMIDRFMRAPGRFDTALVMMSPPDARGLCSLGVQADFLPSFAGQVGRMVGLINPAMPRVDDDACIPYASLAAAIEHDRPLRTMEAPAADDVAVRIAAAAAALVEDGSAVQVGMGQIPSQVLVQLRSHRGLHLHSGVVDDGVLALDEAGALDRDHPVVTGTAVGTPALYAALSDRRRFSLRPVAHTHDPAVMAALPCFTAINSVVQADLLGQVSAEASGGRLVSSPGGLPEFVRGALASDNGRSIIALRAARVGTRSSGIVPLLDPPHAVTGTAADADILVTEFGVAHLRDLSFDRRAEAVIAIADPADQDNLARAWSAMRVGLVGR